MRRTFLTLALIGALLIAAAPVSAQGGSTLVLELKPLEDPVPQGGRAVVPARATYTGDATSMMMLSGIPVTYTVTSGPEWASVSLSPHQDVIHVGGTGPMVMGQSDFLVTIDVSEDAPAGAVGLLEIAAYAQSGVLARNAHAVGALALQVSAAEPACRDGSLVTQAAGAQAPPASGLVLGALGLAAAALCGAVAFAASRRARRAGVASGVLVVLALLLAVSPPAAAQGHVMGSILMAPAEPVEPGAQLVLDGRLTVTTDAVTAASMPHGMAVQLQVVDAPEWAAVVLSPSTIIFTWSPLAGSAAHASANFDAVVHVSGDLDASVIAPIVIQAVGAPGSILASGMVAEASVPLSVRVVPLCPAQAVAPVAEAPLETTDPAEEESVTVQSAGAVPRPLLPVVLTGAALGALTGLLLARRLR